MVYIVRCLIWILIIFQLLLGLVSFLPYSVSWLHSITDAYNNATHVHPHTQIVNELHDLKRTREHCKCQCWPLEVMQLYLLEVHRDLPQIATVKKTFHPTSNANHLKMLTNHLILSCLVATSNSYTCIYTHTRKDCFSKLLPFKRFKYTWRTSSDCPVCTGDCLHKHSKGIYVGCYTFIIIM